MWLQTAPKCDGGKNMLHPLFMWIFYAAPSTKKICLVVLFRCHYCNTTWWFWEKSLKWYLATEQWPMMAEQQLLERQSLKILWFPVPCCSIKLPLTDKRFAAFGGGLMHCTDVIPQHWLVYQSFSYIYTLTSHPESMTPSKPPHMEIYIK